MVAHPPVPVHGRHPLSGPLGRESLVYVFQIPDEQLSVAVYTWVNAHGLGGYVVSVLAPREGAGRPPSEGVDGLELPATQDFDDWRIGDLRIRQDELRSAELSFSGDRLGFDLRFVPTHPAFLYGDAVHRCPPYLGSDRYEQSGRFTGSLRVEDRVIAVDTLGHRDHSWGVRDWAAMQHYTWIVAQTPGAAVHAMRIEHAGTSAVYGYLFQDEQLAELEEVQFRPNLDRRMHVRHVTVEVRDKKQRSATVTAAGFARAKMAVHPTMTLVDTGLTTSIDGEPGVGLIEYAWPPEELARLRERADADERGAAARRSATARRSASDQKA